MPENLADANPRGLHFIVELANAVQDTVQNTVQDGTRVGASDLMELLARHGGPPFRLTEADASRLCDATGELIGILAAKEPDAAAEAINALLRRHPARPHLVRLPGRPWSLHAQADREDGPVPGCSPPPRWRWGSGSASAAAAPGAVRRTRLRALLHRHRPPHPAALLLGPLCDPGPGGRPPRPARQRRPWWGR